VISIRLIPKANIQTILPLLKILDESLDEALLVQRLDAMVADHGYECVGIYDDDTLVGMSGVWILNKYYVGRHIEPDNVIVHPDYRAHRLGARLMEWIHDYAKSKDCLAVELNCYVQNAPGNRFWHKQGYRIIGFHYRKDLA
jgi:GNAT superfamily N-acetyltransferase